MEKRLFYKKFLGKEFFLIKKDNNIYLTVYRDDPSIPGNHDDQILFDDQPSEETFYKAILTYCDISPPGSQSELIHLLQETYCQGHINGLDFGTKAIKKVLSPLIAELSGEVNKRLDTIKRYL